MYKYVKVYYNNRSENKDIRNTISLEISSTGILTVETEEVVYIFKDYDEVFIVKHGDEQ